MNSITTNREFFSEFLVKQTRVSGLWEAVAPLPGGLGGRPLRCRATGPSGASTKIFAEKPLPPRSGATRSRPPGSGAGGVYFCKFRKRKYIFVKNENKKIKKPRGSAPAGWAATASGEGSGSGLEPMTGHTYGLVSLGRSRAQSSSPRSLSPQKKGPVRAGRPVCMWLHAHLPF